MSRAPNLSFNRAGAVPVGADDILFREGEIGKFVAFVAFATLLAVGVVITLWILFQPGYQRALAFIPGFYGAVLALLTWISWHGQRAARGPMNWLVRAAPKGLYIKYRSYLNHAFREEDRVVVFVPKEEIAWVRAHRRREKRPDHDTGNAEIDERHDYLEIGLKGDDLSALAERLAMERGHHEPGKATFRHYPVSVRDGGIIAIEWRSPRSGVRPSVVKAVERIAGLYPDVGPAPALETEDPPVERLAPEDQEARVLELAEKGEVADAVKLARRLYGYDLTEAKTFVEGLSHG